MALAVGGWNLSAVGIPGIFWLDWSRNTSWSKSRSLQMRTWEEETTSFQFYSMRKQDSLRWITPCITTLKPPPFWLEAIDPLPIIQLRVEEERMGGLKPARLLSLWEGKSYRGSMLGTSRQPIWSSQVHGKDKRNKPAYAAVEKPTIPPEVSDKKQASSTKSFRTRFSKNSLNSTLAKDQDPMSLLLKRPTLPMPQVSSHLSQVRTSLRLLTRELRTTWPGQLTTSLIFQTMSVMF